MRQVMSMWWVGLRLRIDLHSKSSHFLGDPPPDPRFLASLDTLSPVEPDHCSVIDLLNRVDRPEGPASKSSLLLGDPPPDPRFLASLDTLSLVQLHNCLS